jgi:hypothetical protein
MKYIIALLIIMILYSEKEKDGWGQVTYFLDRK